MKTKIFWFNSILLSVLLCGAGLAELMIRRQSEATLYLLNKSLASTAFMMITLSYVLSAAHKFWRLPNRILLYRRYIGLTGFGYAVLHITTTFLTPDPAHTAVSKFPFPTYFTDRPVAFLAAALGFSIFSYAFVLSLNPDSHNGTPAKARQWRRRLRYGYLGVLLICVHMGLLKVEGWITWLSTFSPTLPPLSLIVILIILSMITLKVMQLRKEKRIFGKNAEKKRSSVHNIGA